MTIRPLSAALFSCVVPLSLLSPAVSAQPAVPVETEPLASPTPPTVMTASDPTAQLLEGLQAQRPSPWQRVATLDRVAAAEALRLVQTGATQPDGAAVHADLIRHLYIPMLDTTIQAYSSADPAQAIALLQSDLLSAFPLSDPAFTEIGIAREFNTRAKGPNDEILWVLVLAKPLTTPAEDPASPRAGRP